MIAAAYLAKAGYRCLLLEGRPIVGRRRKDRLIDAQRIQGRRLFNSAHVSARQSHDQNDELKLRGFGLEYVDPDPIFHIPCRRLLSDAMAGPRPHMREIREILKEDAAAYRKNVGGV